MLRGWVYKQKRKGNGFSNAQNPVMCNIWSP